MPSSVPSGEPQAESSYTDGSGALFSMYLDRAEEEDRRVVERWKGDADGILVFVRLGCRPETTMLIADTHYRRVCSQPRSPAFLSEPTKHSSPTHKQPRHSISQTYTRFLPLTMGRKRLFPSHLLPIHQLLNRPSLPSGSTPSGS